MAFFTGDSLEPSYADLGRAERWGASAARAYADLFAAEGWDATFLRYPEAYPSPSFLPRQAAPAPGEAETPVHLSFRPARTLNLVKGARNVYACGWRYPVLSRHFSRNTPIQDNMAHMLSLPREIWASSAYAAEVLRREGIETAVAMPAPVPTLTPARDARRTLDGYDMRFNGFNGAPAARMKLDEMLRARAAETGAEPLVFVTVVDPFDPCGGFEHALRGFQIATGASENAVLVAVLALSSEDRAGLGDADLGYRLAERCFRADADLISDRIFLAPERMTTARLGALFQLADFYLCAASAEDQNLALQMAMAHGAVPVSTRVTAMADYLDDANSLAIACRPSAIEARGLSVSAAVTSFAAEVATPRSVARAVRGALGLSAEARGRLSEAARRTIDERYGFRAAAARVVERLEALAEPAAGRSVAPAPAAAAHAQTLAAADVS